MLGDGGVDLPGVVAGVGPDQIEKREAAPHLVEHQRRPVTVLDRGRVDDNAERQAFGVDQRVDLAPLHLLRGVEAYAAVRTTPFSADFTDWLSSTAALGLASRPSCSRTAACSFAQIAAHVPSRWKLRKML